MFVTALVSLNIKAIYCTLYTILYYLHELYGQYHCWLLFVRSDMTSQLCMKVDNMNDQGTLVHFALRHFINS